MTYRKVLVMPRGQVGEAVQKLQDWRGPRTGRHFSVIHIYFPGSAPHRVRGLGADEFLIMTRS